MPVYKYTAKDIKGKTVKGSYSVADEAALVDRLHEDGLFLISSSQSLLERQTYKMKAKDLSSFNRELGTMLSSGVNLIRAMEIILKRDAKPKQKLVYEDIYRSLLEGKALSEALDDCGGVFPPLLINMYRAAEANGTIDLTAMRMADHYEKEHRLKSKIKSATAYPIILLCLTIVVLIIIFTFVLGNFIDLYGNMELPAITRGLLAINDALTHHYLTVISVAAIIVLGIALLSRIRAVRYAFDHLKIRLPGIGKLMRIIYTARFARTLSSLYSSGLSILSALQISRGTIGNLYIADQFPELIRKVREGSSLSAALADVDGYDPKLSATVLIGEESGKLESMLLSVSDSFDYEAEQATTRLVTILEPLLIIIMAVIIGTVMIGVMLPIYGMYNNISQMG